MVWILGFFTLFGFNFTIWLSLSFIRFVVEKIFSLQKNYGSIPIISQRDVAAIVPAHNEELTIKRTLNGLLKVLPQKNIYVANDNSTDSTMDIVHNMGIRTIEIKPNQGKAKSLVWIMREYGLLEAYKLILINDADTEIDPNYIKRALPIFNDPEIACVAGHGVSRLQNYSFLEKYYIAYRIRLWRIIQWGMRFGQTWKYTNMSFIVPGSLSMYRTNILKKLEIDAPGLIIEDFNMTFEVHKKKLGKIAYSPRIFGIHQDPYNFRDYVKQIKRWNVGFFQTVKRHGIWPSFFWLSTTVFYGELFLYAIFVIYLPILLVLFLLNDFEPLRIPFVYERLAITDVLIGVFLMDYLTTIIAAILERKPILLIYGLGFFIIRYVEAVIYIFSPFIAFTSRSSGRWKSPKRL